MSAASPAWMPAVAWPRPDARWFQLLFLGSFLALGAWARDFALTGPQVLLTLVSAVLTQAAWQWGLNLPSKKRWDGYLSALVTSLGICILVRAEHLWAHPLLAGLAMSSKYLIRLGPPGCKSHVMNPANLAAYAAWAWVPGAWLSPGQWGSESLAALWFIALGGVVTQRVRRWGCQLGVFADLGAAAGRSFVVAGLRLEPRRGDVVAATEQRRGAAVRLLHDF